MKRILVSIVAVLLLLVAPVVGQKQNHKPRIILDPPSYFRAERFLELNEPDQMMYTAGLMDGFYASTFFGATDETVSNLKSCTEKMDNKQVSAIITKYVKDHPERWHFALSALAHTALDNACPGGLRIIDAKK
jgi:hypothetical protein